MSKPKILILNQPFILNSGGGITLSNLLTGWEKDKIAVACLGHLLNGDFDKEICDTYYRIGEKEYKWIFPFSLITSKYASGPVKFEEKKIKKIEVSRSKLRVSLIRNYFFPFLEYTGVFHLLSKIELSPELKEWLKEVNPDIIYAQAPTRETLNFCLAVHQYLEKPMVYHVMDDWPSTIGRKGLFKRFWRKVVHKELSNLLDRSSLLMSISDYMSEEYKRRYDKHFIPFHNPIDVDFWKKHQRNQYTLPEEPTILYAGRIGLGIQSSLETMATAIQNVNQAIGSKAKLVLQTGERPSWIDKFDCVQHRNFVPYEELPRVFAEADFLILPYDFTTTANQFIKYSMPTKASEYMASGTPIIIFAPEDTAMVRYAKAHQWAEVVTQNDLTVLSEALKEMLTNENKRTAIAQRAINIAESRHDLEQVAQQFQGMLQRLSGEVVNYTEIND